MASAQGWSKKRISLFSLLKFTPIKLLFNLTSTGESFCCLTSKQSLVAYLLQMRQPKPKRAPSQSVRLTSLGIVKPVFRQTFSSWRTNFARREVWNRLRLVSLVNPAPESHTSANNLLHTTTYHTSIQNRFFRTYNIGRTGKKRPTK